MKREGTGSVIAGLSARHDMKLTLLLLLAFSFTLAAVAQSPKSKGRPRPKPSPTVPKPMSEAESYDAAAALEDPEARAAALKAFLEKFPDSEKKAAARELLTVALTESANVKMQVGDVEGGVEQFREAVEAAPDPVPDKLFTETVSKIVPSLYFHGEQRDALAIGEILEPKIKSSTDQLLSLGNFYVSIENGSGAKRVAQMAIEASPESSNAYLLLATAHRLQFELEQSAVAYSKAADLDPASEQARRGLGDMYRALGRYTDAAAQYKEILSKDEASIPARTGLILSLFDSGEKAAAERELDAALEANPGNVILLAGAAYWYAVHSEPDRAIELSQKAIAAEPRYVWSHMALARAYFAKNQPLDAEQALLRGREYGRFPTLEYELALSRAKAGLYREAIEGLRGSFTVEGDKIKVELGGRVERADTSFADLLAPERKASIFEPETSDDPETAAKLKALLAFDKALQSPTVNEEELGTAVDRFTAGDDAMKVHRQIYVASALLDKKVALRKVEELTKSAVAYTDQGLNAPNAGAAIMASELYDSRMLALSKNEYLHIPDVPKPTLSAILRGRIEEIAGWALYQEGKPADAVVRLRRAVSVLPDKSAWWRSSTWKLGAALQADGKDAEALDSYVKSYKADKPDAARYIVLAALYKKVKGNDEGLDAEVGPNPMPVVAVNTPEPAKDTPPPSAQPVTSVPEPSPSIAAPVSTPAAEEIPKEVPVAPTTVEPAAEESKTLNPQTAPSETPAPVVESTPVPDARPAEKQTGTETGIKREPAAAASPSVTPAPEPSVTPVPQDSPAVVVEATPSPSPQPEQPSAVPEPTPTVRPEPMPSPTIVPETTPAVDLPTAVPSPTPTAAEPVTLPSPTPETAEPRQDEPAKPAPENTEPPPVEVKKVEIPPSEPPGKSPEPEPSPKPSSLAVVVTDNIPPPTKILPPSKTRSRYSAAPKNDTSKPTSASSGTPFEPVVISIPNRTLAERSAPVQPRTCTVSVSQDRISLAGGGGNIGLLVGTGDPNDLPRLKYYSSSPADISVRQESRIAGEDRAFFVVRSLSRNTGVYQVIFEAPCGKKQVIVNVR